MNKKFWITLEAIMLIIWIVTTSIFAYTVFTKGTKCLTNPLIYGTDYLSEKNDVELRCSCVFDNEQEYRIMVEEGKARLEINQVEVQESTFKTFNINFTGDTK